MRPGPRTWGRDGVARWKQNWLRCELSTLQFPSICLQLGRAKTSMDQRAPTPWSDTARAVHKLTQPERSGQYNPDVRHRSQTLCPRRSSTKKRQRALENIGGSWRSWVASSTLWACLMHPKIHLNVRATPPLLRRLDAPMVAAKTAGLSLSLYLFLSLCVCYGFSVGARCAQTCVGRTGWKTDHSHLGIFLPTHHGPKNPILCHWVFLQMYRTFIGARTSYSLKQLVEKTETHTHPYKYDIFLYTYSKAAWTPQSLKCFETLL